MLPQILNFIEQFFKDHKDISGSVLDVGSRDISNLGDIRYAIPSTLRYTGMDISGGQNVHLVMDAYDIKKKLKPESYDVVMCTEVLEHIAKPWIIVENMRWVLKPGGWLIITVPSLNHGRHDWPGDYYRFFETVLGEVFFEGMDNIYTLTVKFPLVGGSDLKPDAILGYAQKRS